MAKLSSPEERHCRECNKTFWAEYSNEFYCSWCWKTRMGTWTDPNTKKYEHDCPSCIRLEEKIIELKNNQLSPREMLVLNQTIDNLEKKLKQTKEKLEEWRELIERNRGKPNEDKTGSKWWWW